MSVTYDLSPTKLKKFVMGFLGLPFLKDGYHPDEIAVKRETVYEDPPNDPADDYEPRVKHEGYTLTHKQQIEEIFSRNSLNLAPFMMFVEEKPSSRWIKGEEIGKGNKGAVYSVYDPSDKQPKALKLQELFDRPTEAQLSLQSFAQEVYFTHVAANIGVTPQIYDYGLDGNTGWYVSKRLDVSLKQFRERFLRMSTVHKVDKVLMPMYQIDRRLWARGIAHSDMHYSNYMYSENEEKWYIIDWGQSTFDDSYNNISERVFLDKELQHISFEAFGVTGGKPRIGLFSEGATDRPFIADGFWEAVDLLRERVMQLPDFDMNTVVKVLRSEQGDVNAAAKKLARIGK
jgi:predicted Ser/Thr protein kinase